MWFSVVNVVEGGGLLTTALAKKVKTDYESLDKLKMATELGDSQVLKRHLLFMQAG